MNEHTLPQKYNCLVVLGPTAVGKTSLAVRLADHFDGEIIAVDSRQVYKYLDIGSGKDIADYTLQNPTRTIPYHLIDVAELPVEYSVYEYQAAVYKTFPKILEKGKLPVFCGGTGMYLQSVVQGLDLVDVPCNEELRNSLAGKSDSELTKILLQLKNGKLHNHTDTEERHRLLRAIEIETFVQQKGNVPVNSENKMTERPDIRPYIFGTTFPRDFLRSGIKKRLIARLNEGLIEEVEALNKMGIPYARLERLGLEYRFVSEFLEGKIATKDELTEKLYIAIGQFAKRQETWFRRMERQGIKINWLPYDGTEQSRTVEWRFEKALEMLKKEIIE